jgi:hypothetical protein
MGLSLRVVLLNEILCLAFAAWGVREAITTHDTLAKNRANLLEEIRIIGE